MYKFANSHFHDLLHKTTVQRGLDPRRFALFSFGGTAGMHVGAYGEELGVSAIVIPQSASVHGAFGLVTSDVAHEDQITHPLRAPFDAPAIGEIYEQLERRIVAQLEAEGFEADQMRLTRAIDMRYRRQVHIVTVPYDSSLEGTLDLFERLYEEKYGPQSAYREAGVELVSFRVRGVGSIGRHDFRAEDLQEVGAEAALVKHVTAWVDKAGAMQEIPGYDFELLRPGNVVTGPSVVWSPITTLVVPPGHAARLDEYRSLVITRT
jgi:N-methylhydantoinase A